MAEQARGKRLADRDNAWGRAMGTRPKRSPADLDQARVYPCAHLVGLMHQHVARSSAPKDGFACTQCRGGPASNKPRQGQGCLDPTPHWGRPLGERRCSARSTGRACSFLECTYAVSAHVRRRQQRSLSPCRPRRWQGQPGRRGRAVLREALQFLQGHSVAAL